MTPMIQARYCRSNGLIDPSHSVFPGPQGLDRETQLPVKSHFVAEPDPTVNRCLGLIMVGQGFVFLVAALTMLVG